MPGAVLEKSKGAPGVFGVFEEEPKEAKAPEPKPKAVEAPEFGEDIALVVKGEKALKGLRPPCEESPPPPKRLAEGTVLDCESGLASLSLFVERESLLALFGWLAVGNIVVRGVILRSARP